MTNKQSITLEHQNDDSVRLWWKMLKWMDNLFKDFGKWLYKNIISDFLIHKESWFFMYVVLLILFGSTKNVWSRRKHRLVRKISECNLYETMMVWGSSCSSINATNYCVTLLFGTSWIKFSTKDAEFMLLCQSIKNTLHISLKISNIIVLLQIVSTCKVSYHSIRKEN